MKTFIIAWLFCMPAAISSQIHSFSSYVPRSESLGGCRSALTGAVGMWGNPAGLAGLAAREIHLTARQGYALAGLETVQTGFLWSEANRGLGLSASHFGTAGYREQELALSGAIQLSPSVAIGLRGGYVGQGVDEAGVSGSVSSRIGIQVRLDEHWLVSSVISQPWGGQLAGGWDAGVAFSPSATTLWTSEITAEWGFAPIFRTGFEYHLSHTCLIRAGIQLSPSVFAFGLGVLVGKSCTLACSASYDLLLGMTPGIGLHWQIEGQAEQ